MNVNILSISDWVNFISKPSETRSAHKVLAIEDGRVKIDNGSSKPEDAIWVDEMLVEPIGITEGFFENNGFERLPGDVFIKTGEFVGLRGISYIYEISALSMIGDIYSVEMSFREKRGSIKRIITLNYDGMRWCFVHDVQQALRLCGLSGLADSLLLDYSGKEIKEEGLFDNAYFGKMFITDENDGNGGKRRALYIGRSEDSHCLLVDGYHDVDYFNENGFLCKCKGESVAWPVRIMHDICVYDDEFYRKTTVERLARLTDDSGNPVFSRKQLEERYGLRCSAGSLMHYLDENRCEEKVMCLSNGECEQIDKAYASNDWGTIIRYIGKYIYNIYTEK